MQGFHCHLLDGITGSGKTEVYLQLLSEVLASGRQALALVPEIGLTPQLLRRFRTRLGVAPVVSHSGLSAGERMQAWAAALRGDARLLLGTRSALFLPLREPGLIIMDEAHDPSFKQQDGFRFSAADVAVMRARALDIPIVLGTATPTLESLHNARSGRYQWHRLRQRATGASEPAWKVVDLRAQPVSSGLSQPTLNAMRETLTRGEQVLVFLNRRGYAPVLLCHSCGWHAGCPRCDANLTWHRSTRQLSCHHCEHRQAVPVFCPDCTADALQGAGEGTEQLEQWLSQEFEGVALHRVDRDRVRRKGELEAIVEEVRKGEPCLLVGTQMLAKGHHFPKVTLVVVVNLDQALYSADFRAVERMAQTLVQVAGRAGRAEHPGSVILQTHHPDHPGLQLLMREGYEAFARDQLQERELSVLPPFSYQAVLRAEAVERDHVLDFLNAAAACCGKPGRPHGPFPAMMERRGGRLRWYLLLQQPSRAQLQAILARWLPQVRELPQARRVRWSVDVDPQEF
jgi:primosomal protein N' (replication factor Y)